MPRDVLIDAVSETILLHEILEVDPGVVGQQDLEALGRFWRVAKVNKCLPAGFIK